MSKRFYLVQRGFFNKDLNSATSFLSNRSNSLINLDYMGAAEFEFGAIPKAYRRILGQFKNYELHVTDLTTSGGVPFCIFCESSKYKEVLEAIKSYLNNDFTLKELSNMKEHFKSPSNSSTWETQYSLQTNFWWCIDRGSNDYVTGDWIAFTGATDRQKKFLEVLNKDYTDWWMQKSEEDRNKEYKEAQNGW